VRCILHQNDRGAFHVGRCCTCLLQGSGELAVRQLACAFGLDLQHMHNQVKRTASRRAGSATTEWLGRVWFFRGCRLCSVQAAVQDSGDTCNAATAGSHANPYTALASGSSRRFTLVKMRSQSVWVRLCMRNRERRRIGMAYLALYGTPFRRTHWLSYRHGEHQRLAPCQ
jgi:hypothetical protein